MHIQFRQSGFIESVQMSLKKLRRTETILSDADCSLMPLMVFCRLVMPKYGCRLNEAYNNRGNNECWCCGGLTLQ